MAASLDKRVQKGALSAQEKQATLQRLQTTIRYEDLARVQIAIETATEQPQLKFELLRRMESALPAHALIGSNTSSISITQLAAALREPSRLVGLHFFNPVPAMALVEVIRGLQTSEEAYDRAMVFARALGKTPIPVANRPGFVVNRILIPMVNEAIFAVQERLGSVDDIDTAMQIGGGHPIGPLRLADVVGLDVVLAVMEVLQASFGDNKYRPAFLLREMVQAGLLGRKTGQGFYKY
jgi:3-hydroxybutyryl-CoA dehydrogenase